MNKRKKRIQNETDYLKYLRQGIHNSDCRNHFWAAVEWRQPQAESYRWKYYFLQWVHAILGIIIISLGAIQSTNIVGIFIVIAGGLSTLITFILSLHRYHDSWKRYRSSVEKIKSLTRIYLSKNEPFNSKREEDNDKLYVLELDKIINDESDQWKKMRDNQDLSQKPLKY